MSAIVYAGVRYPIANDAVTAALWSQIIEHSARSERYTMMWTGSLDSFGDIVQILLGPGIPVALHLTPVDGRKGRPTYEQALELARESKDENVRYLGRTAEFIMGQPD